MSTHTVACHTKILQILVRKADTNTNTDANNISSSSSSTTTTNNNNNNRNDNNNNNRHHHDKRYYDDDDGSLSAEQPRERQREDEEVGPHNPSPRYSLLFVACVLLIVVAMCVCLMSS